MPVLVRRYGKKALIFGLNIALQLMVVKLGVLQWLGIEAPQKVIVVHEVATRTSVSARSTPSRRPIVHSAAKRSLEMQ